MVACTVMIFFLSKGKRGKSICVECLLSWNKTHSTFFSRTSVASAHHNNSHKHVRCFRFGPSFVTFGRVPFLRKHMARRKHVVFSSATKSQYSGVQLWLTDCRSLSGKNCQETNLSENSWSKRFSCSQIRTCSSAHTNLITVTIAECRSLVCAPKNHNKYGRKEIERKNKLM